MSMEVEEIENKNSYTSLDICLQNMGFEQVTIDVMSYPRACGLSRWDGVSNERV